MATVSVTLVFIQISTLYLLSCYGKSTTTTKPATTTTTTTTSSTITTTIKPDPGIPEDKNSTSDDDDDGSVKFFIGGGSRPYRKTTTTTQRPFPDLSSYEDLDRNHRQTSSTPTPDRWSTHSKWSPPSELELLTSSTTISTSIYYPNPNRSRRPAPSVNFAASSSVNNIINAKWTDTNTALVYVKNVRQLVLTFVCNASYPIEWLSQTSFGTTKWEVGELRYFPLSPDQPKIENGEGDSSWFPQTLRHHHLATYTVLLTLTYEKDTFPNNLELNCGSVRTTSRSAPRKQTLIEISKGMNFTLHFTISNDIRQWPRESLPSISQEQKLQYTDPLGTNEGCLVDLYWILKEKSFGCTTEQPFNVTIDDKEDNCYDAASCERRFTTNKCFSGNPWKYPHSTLKRTSDIWNSESISPAGVVFCRRDEDAAFENRTAAIEFFHSLAPVCPEDDVSTRRQLYTVVSHVPLDTRPPLAWDTFERDFVSFCATPRTWDDNLKQDTQPSVVYAGEQMSVTCVASLYHFAMGTRIGIKYYDNQEIEYAHVMEPHTMINRGSGSFNFTAKVYIKSQDAEGLICENYMKRSTESVQKFIPLQVQIPINISFVGGLATDQFATWVYTGQSDFVLRCEAMGDPVPTINWKKQGRKVPDIIVIENTGPSQSVLRFPSLEDKEFSVADLYGSYTCEARNSLDSEENIFHVQSSNSSGLPFVIADASSSLWVLWVVLPIFVVVVLVVIGVLIWKIKIQSKELRLLTKAEVDEFIFGKPELIQHASSSEEVNNYAPWLPYNKGYEIARDQLEIDENAVLGSGAYAIVLRGVLTQKGGDKTKVAIKTSRAMDDISYFKALLSELKIMGFIGTHHNIVNLVGAHTKNIQNREIYIAIEYCENGNLLRYLRDHRNGFSNLVAKTGDDYDFLPGGMDAVTRASFLPGSNNGLELNTVTLIKWSYEVATGMEFLSQKKVIHGDLAGRNILVTEYLIAKIGDFGLSRQLFEYANYIKKHQSPLPWKWLAIECLQDMRFSVKSDVWAFGILLFEIFSLGQVPYPGLSYNDEFLDSLVAGKRPNRPSHASTNIYDFMETCWKDKAEERPDFTQVRAFFNNLLSTLVPQEYLDLHEKVASVIIGNANNNGSGSSSLHVPTITTCAMVHRERSFQSTSSNETPNKLDAEDGKHTRFSFNTKTITALFHRN